MRRKVKILERNEFLKKLNNEFDKEALLFIVDIDDFKIVNFSYGYDAGNKVLFSFFKLIASAAFKYYENFFIGKVACNAVAVFVKDVISDREIVYKKLKEIYDKHFERINFYLSRDAFSLTTSCGAAFMSPEQGDGETLFKKSEEALYNAKKKGKHTITFADDILIDVERVRDIRKKILHALEKRSIEPYFQPVVSLRTGRIFGYEVLARIFYKDELLKGDSVIDVANTFNLISEVDKIIFEKASKYLDNGYKLFINLSMKYFFKELNNIWQVVKDRNLNSQNIVIEITESQKIMEMGVAKSIFQIFRDINAKVAIDDFGSGYSSFNYLKRFPADILKVDGEFVKDAKNNIKDLTIMKSMVDVGKVFGMRVLAEFIEDEEDYRLMRDIGVALGQGWFIGKPEPEPYSVKIDI